MINVNQIQIYAVSRWGKLTAFALAAVFVLLSLLKIYSAIAFFATSNKSSTDNQSPISTQQAPAVDLSTLHVFGNYQPKNINPNELPKATLNIQLNGVFVAVPKKLSQAVLSEPGGKQKVYYEGDELPGNAKLYEILNNSVIIQYDGQLQKLLLPESSLKFGNKPEPLDLPKTNRN